MGKKYRYQRLVVSEHEAAEVLNRYGEIGYQAIHITERNGRYIVIMMKEVTEVEQK